MQIFILALQRVQCEHPTIQPSNQTPCRPSSVTLDCRFPVCQFASCHSC